MNDSCPWLHFTSYFTTSRGSLHTSGIMYDWERVTPNHDTISSTEKIVFEITGRLFTVMTKIQNKG